MTDWIRSQVPLTNPSNLGVLQLAWLGDAVWEMHHRLRQCRKSRRPKDLHKSVVEEVKASAQAKALDLLKNYLSPEEIDLVRRGRNKAGKGPRSREAAIYGKATGFETIIGWLFLNNPQRLAQLLDQLDKAESDQI